jgi:uncharacterized protein (DUF1501 family)
MPPALRSRRSLFTLFADVLAPAPARRALVTVFLRGGADGLALVPPHGDPALARLRPALVQPPPGAEPTSVLDLDGTFGLHPALAPLLPWWHDRRLAIVHAVGSDDATRSHFEAQDQMEQGASCGRSLAGGWLGRLLRAEQAAGLSAVALGPYVPEALRGAPMVAAMESLDALGARTRGLATDALERLYGLEQGLLAQAGRDTFDLLRRVHGLERRPLTERPVYPEGAFGAGLRDLADLLRADLGLRAACLDLAGWDTHFFQGTGAGPLASRADELARGLAAFLQDLGPRAGAVDVVVLTEFGRRAHENASLGTDHGRGSVLFVIGDGLRGGQVHGRWPGLAEAALEGPGDLAVTTDYRDVLCEVIAHAGGPSPGEVFPGHVPRPVGLLG